jgi:hypothetical protein
MPRVHTHQGVHSRHGFPVFIGLVTDEIQGDPRETLDQVQQIHLGELAEDDIPQRLGVADAMAILSQKQVTENVAGLKDVEDFLLSVQSHIAVVC